MKANYSSPDVVLWFGIIHGSTPCPFNYVGTEEQAEAFAKVQAKASMCTVTLRPLTDRPPDAFTGRYPNVYAGIGHVNPIRLDDPWGSR